MKEKYMQRCLQLAQNGLGHVSPNPLVGAVIIHKDTIIGEGYHRQYGESHAEVNAVASVKDPTLLSDSTLYVNLEPCSHFGKTPPCAALIIEKKIPRVVVGHQDPYPQVSGRGIKMLRDAGVEVVCDFMKEDCEEVNKRFLTFYKKKRPYILLKWAQSSDNFLDRYRLQGDGNNAVQFSNILTRMMVHKMRAEEDAIMVGTRTVLLDNPSLTTRYWAGKNPLRITIDRNLNLQENFNLMDNKSQVLIFTEQDTPDTDIRYCKMNFGADDLLFHIVDELYRRKVQSLIVEGGTQLLSSFISSGLWDEMDVEIASVRLHDGVRSPQTEGLLEDVKKCKQSIVYVYKNLIIP